MTDRSESGLDCGAWMATQIDSGGVDAHTDRRTQGKKRHQDNTWLARCEHPRNRVLNRALAQSHPCSDANHRTRPLVYHTKNEHNNGCPNDTGDVLFNSHGQPLDRHPVGSFIKYLTKLPTGCRSTRLIKYHWNTNFRNNSGLSQKGYTQNKWIANFRLYWLG